MKSHSKNSSFEGAVSVFDVSQSLGFSLLTILLPAHARSTASCNMSQLQQDFFFVKDGNIKIQNFTSDERTVIKIAYGEIKPGKFNIWWGEESSVPHNFCNFFFFSNHLLFCLLNKQLEWDLGEDTIENEQILQTLPPLNFAYTKIFWKQKTWKCFLTASLGLMSLF